MSIAVGRRLVVELDAVLSIRTATVQPTADYDCLRCGATESTSGALAVPPFTLTVREQHRAVCTNPRTEHGEPSCVERSL